MQVDVTFLTRRGADALMRKTQPPITAESVRFGRGTDNEVQLPDIRVGLHAAVLTMREAGLFVERAGEDALQVNGTTVLNSPVHPGDKVAIGPYEVTIVEPQQGFDAALTVELVRPLGDALERILARSRIGLAQAGWSRRRWSWVGFLVFAILGLALPLLAFPFGPAAKSSQSVPSFGFVSLVDLGWNPGDISNPHRFFAYDCATCHTGPFAEVSDQACLTCHTTVGNHFTETAGLAAESHELGNTRCADCHEEHRGSDGLVINADALCTSCHATLHENAPGAGVADVSGFPQGHPQFSATLVADAAKPTFVHAELGTNPPPQDHSGLIFSHEAHLIPTGLPTATGHVVMTCTDCHKPDATGQGFQPITFETDCHSCHDLKFDAQLPWKEVPHGDATMVQATVEDFYANIALQGGVQNDATAPEFVRRPVGTPVTPTPQQRQDALAWAVRRSAAAMSLIDDPKRGCAYCHETSFPNGKLAVAPVFMPVRYMPDAAFDHSQHQALPCADCHDADHSEKSSDVLLPGINSCVNCHGPARAALSTQSTCISCHQFHRLDLGPMRTALKLP